MKLTSLMAVGLLLLSAAAQAHTLDKVDLEAWLDGFVPYALDSTAW